MQRTIFIVAGFKHAASEKQYEWMRHFFATKDLNVKIPDIQWNNRVMSDYVIQFRQYYQEHKTEENYILGFSFGAMTAMIAAQDIRPDKLYLCSLSPYFKEDIHTLKKSWREYVGTNRIQDFQKHSAAKLAREINIDTTIFYGEVEGRKYPQLKARCVETNQLMRESKLVIVAEAPHEIDYPTYIAAIKSEFA